MRDARNVVILRKRLPNDLRRLKGEKVTLPVGDEVRTVKINEFVQVSLRTKDEAEGKARYAIAAEALERFWQAQRNGPQKLTTKQAVALSGRLYNFLVEMFGDDPPGGPDFWLRLEVQNILTTAGKYGLSNLAIGVDNRKTIAVEARFGGIADALLARKQTIVDKESRTKLVKAIQTAMEDVVTCFRRNAEVDYSDDPAAIRFPPWEPPVGPAKRAATSRLTISALFEASATANATSKAPASIIKLQLTNWPLQYLHY